MKNIRIDQTFNTSQTRSFVFRQGHIFVGKINRIHPGDIALLQIGNQEYTAKLDFGLKIGQQYLFLVQHVSKHGVPYITTMGDKNNKKDPIQTLISNLSLPNNKMTRDIVANLISVNHSLNYGSITSIFSWLQQLNGTQLKLGLKVIEFMIEHRLPFELKIYQALFEFHTTKSISRQLIDLKERLQQHKLEHNAIQQVVSLIDQLENEENVPIRKLLTILGINYEASIRKMIIGSTIQAHKSFSLKAGLMKLLTINIDSEINKTVQRILDWINGQQMINKDEIETISSYLLQLPVSFGKEQFDLWVNIQGYQRDGILDSNNNRLTFFVHLTSLKDIVVELTIQKKIVTIKLFNEHNLTHLLPILTPYLKERLATIGYHLSSINSRKVENVRTLFFSKDEKKVDFKI